jgi:transcriptional regulator with XRE-family HTH domain
MTEKVLLKKLAARIKQLRVAKGLTQQEFAALMDYEKSNMSRMESGNVNLRVTTLYKVAKVLGITIQELLDFK